MAILYQKVKCTGPPPVILSFTMIGGRYFSFIFYKLSSLLGFLAMRKITEPQVSQSESDFITEVMYDLTATTAPRKPQSFVGLASLRVLNREPSEKKKKSRNEPTNHQQCTVSILLIQEREGLGVGRPRYVLARLPSME